MDIPYANYLTAFVIGEYVDVKQNYGDIELHNYGYPKETEAVTASVERLPDMVEFYSSFTGIKYPFGNYSQVIVQDIPWGIANGTFATQTENMIDDDRTHADFFYLWDGLGAETLASQWFGTYLSCRDWSDIWLSKGFAHYFDGLYNEYRNGREEFLLWQLSGDHNTYLADWNAGVRHPVVNRYYDNTDAIANDNYPYIRGALVLHMLRKQLGETNFKKAINHYVVSNGNRLVTTEDFCKAIEDATGESIGWFFDQWIYKIGHPVFEVSKQYDAVKKQLVLTVKQTQQSDPKEKYPQVDFFKGKIAIAIDGRIEEVWLEAKQINTFRFDSPQEPRLINFDYENTWIKELKFERSFEELLYQLKNDKDILARRAAITELVQKANDEKTTAADKATIYAAFRDIALSNSYWRLRLAAISQLQSLLVAGGSQPAVLDTTITDMLLTISKNEKAWLRAGAISLLGATQDAKYADLYINYLNDTSDRVINAAAIALGKSKSPKAFAALKKLVNKPSWKNQSLMSALAGLKALGDPRGFDIAYKALSDLRLLRWRLPTPPVWDLRIFAAQTIVSLGKANTAYPLVFHRFKQSMNENDLSGIFNNVLLAITLGDERGQEIFDQLKIKFKEDSNSMLAVNQYEAQFKEAIKKK